MTLRLVAASYRRLHQRQGEPHELLQAMADHIAADVLDMESRGLLENVSRHYVCSTILGLPLNYGVTTWAALYDDMRGRLGRLAPPVLVTVYECASWGYVLDYWFNRCKRSGPLLVTIADCNPLRLEEWERKPHWGDSGFGYTLLCLERTDGLTNETIGVDVTDSERALLAFCTFVRRRARVHPAATISLPFNLPETRRIIDSYMGGAPTLPDLHVDWGHCFGSDPWIGLIHDRLTEAQAAPRGEKLYLVCSNGLGGFFCTAYVTADADTFAALHGP